MSPAFFRNKGFIEKVRQYDNLTVVDTLIAVPNERIETQLPTVLKNNPTANVIFGHSDFLAEKAHEICKNLGVEQNYMFIGIDGVPGVGKGIGAVETGILDATILYPQGGGEAIKLAVKILKGEKFEKENTLATTVIDASNAKILNSQFDKVNQLQRDIDRQTSLVTRLESIYSSQRNLIFLLIIALVGMVILGITLWRSLKAKQLINNNLKQKNKEVLEKQEQLLTQQNQLIEMSREVEKATTAKMNFFTNISHEFRTPLTLILGLTKDTLQNSRLSKTFGKDLQIINDNAMRLLRLVNQLMDFRKIEADKLEVYASKNNLLTFIHNIMKAFHNAAEKRNIDFQFITREEDLMVWFDVDMMDKVLFNLLSNAFKHTADNGKIHLLVQRLPENNQVEIKVEDNGKGMTAAVAQHIFEPFYQSKEGRQVGGTGLGLALSKSLIDLHKGTITVTSEVDKGTTFTILLPSGNAHFENDQLSNETKNLFGIHNIKKSKRRKTNIKPKDEHSKHILIIEDNDDLQYFLSKQLGQTYHIHQATDGETGIKMAIAKTPDLIISDINMPKKNGLEVTKILKEDLRTSHIPILILTARSSVENQIIGAKVGADDYVVKPFNFELLQEKIKTLLKNRQIIKDIYSKGLTVIQEGKTGINKLDEQFVKQLTGYIQNNYNRHDFKVKDLAKHLNLSQSQLYRKTKALLGISVSDYLQTTRLQKAEELLRKTELSITDIAYEVGYTSPDYFSTVFKSKYNCSPSQYRR